MAQTKFNFLENKLVWFALALITVLPLLFVTNPPLIDVFGHMGRYTVQLHGSDPEIAQWYEHNWVLVPNLGVDLIVQFFGQFMGVEAATKWAVVLIPLFMTTGIILTYKTVHGYVSPIIFLALPLIYNYAFIFGFINFTLSVALALILYAFGVRQTQKSLHVKSPLRFQLIMTILLCGVWVAHIYGWAIFCILWGSHILASEFTKKKSFLSWILKTSRHCLFLLIPLIILIILSAKTVGGASNTGGWFMWDRKIFWFLAIVRDQWEIWDVGFILLSLATFIFLAISGKGRFAPGLLLAASFMGFFALILPFNLLSSSYADMRLFPYAFMIGLLSVGIRDFKTDQTFWRVALIIFAGLFLARMGGNFVSAQHHDKSIQAEAQMLDHVPQNAKLISFVYSKCAVDTGWSGHRFNHIPSLALVRRRAFANNMWMAEGAHLLIVKNQLPIDPSHFVGPENCYYQNLLEQSRKAIPGDFNYMWVINPESEEEIYNPTEWELIKTLGKSRLYYRP